MTMFLGGPGTSPSSSAASDAHRLLFLVCILAFLVATAVSLSVEDSRYLVLLLLSLGLAVTLLFVGDRLGLLRNLLVFSIALRVLNANLGKRFSALELTFPTLNIYEILLVAVFVGLVGRWVVSGRRIEVPRGWSHVLFLGLVCLFLVSLLAVSETPEFGFQRFFTVVEMYLTYVALFNLCKEDQDILAVVRIVVYTVAFEAILVVLEIVLGTSSPLFRFVAGAEILAGGNEGVISGRRIAGSFGDAVVFGWVMGFLFFYLLPFAIVRTPRLFIHRRWIVLALLAVFSFGLLTMTRTSLVAELVLAPLGVYLLSRSVDHALWKWIPRMLTAGAVTIAILLLLPGAASLFTARSADAGELEGTIELRMVSWNVGWRILQDFPILGMGVGTGSVLAHSSQQLAGYIESPEENERIAYAGIHNGHAIMFAEMGSLGYALYLAFLGVFARDGWRLIKRRRTVLECQIGAMGIMVVGFLFLSDFTGVAIAFRSAMYYVALALALVSVLMSRQSASGSKVTG